MSAASSSRLFTGQITHLAHGRIEGWALAFSETKKHQDPVWLHVLLDGQEIDKIACTLPRPEIAKSYRLAQADIGFCWDMPKKFYDGIKRRVSLRFPDRSILPFPAALAEKTNPDPNAFLEEWIFNGKKETDIRSTIDGLQNGRLKGWIIQRTGRFGRWRGQMVLDVHVDGRPLARIKANKQRADVSRSLQGENFSKYPPDPACGFDLKLPASLCDGRPHQFQIFLSPSGAEISASPFRARCATEEMSTKLANLNTMLDALQAQLTELRREALALLPPKDEFSLETYNAWHQRYDQALSEKTAQQRRESPLKAAPLLSIICPIFHPEKTHLTEALRSVESQTYENWELIAVFDGPQKKNICQTLAQFQKTNPKIHLIETSQQNGISKATNEGIKQAKGEYVLFLDHDDLLAPQALETMLRAALETRAEVLYSDEDILSTGGEFIHPHFKPDFDYRYLLGCNYICHLTMFRADFLRKLGGLRKDYDGAQDHDLLLRAYEANPHGFFHVPEILYHWRQSLTSTAFSGDNKPYAARAGVKAVRHHLSRQGHLAKTAMFNKMTFYRTFWQLPENPPEICVIIPFRDQADMTALCVERLLKHQTYPNFSVLLVDNFSTSAESVSFLKKATQDKRVSVLKIEEAFNFSRLNNLAAAQTSAPYLLFLNNDVEIKEKDFLAKMMGDMLHLPDAGAVGARLLYPSNLIQHAGVAVGPEVVGLHVHSGLDHKQAGYMGRAVLSHEVSAVTGAAMLVKKEAFLQVGGFDAKALAIAFNDVDLCLKLRKAGLHIYYCAQACAIHHESFSRGSDELPWNERRFFQEKQEMLARWGGEDFFQKDPFYPQNFTLEGESFFHLRTPKPITQT